MIMEKLPVTSLAVCVFTGAMFAAGWWAVALGLYLNSISEATSRFSLIHVFLPLLSTAGVVLLTTVSRNSIITSNDFLADSSGPHKMLLFSYIAMAVAGFGVSLGLYAVYHANMAVTANAIMIPIGAGLIAFSGLIAKFARPPPSDEVF